jgi:hypothetical protein
MAKVVEWDEVQKRNWSDWVASRPDCVRVVCERLPVDRLYRMTSTKQRVTVRSFNEDGTVTVRVSAKYNFIATHERDVFGIDPNDLQECELPEKDEIVGLLDVNQLVCDMTDEYLRSDTEKN